MIPASEEVTGKQASNAVPPSSAAAAASETPVSEPEPSVSTAATPAPATDLKPRNLVLRLRCVHTNEFILFLVNKSFYFALKSQDLLF